MINLENWSFKSCKILPYFWFLSVRPKKRPLKNSSTRYQHIYKDLPEKLANLCFLIFILREFGGMYTTTLHLFDDLLYGVALSIMSQDRSYSSFFSFRCHIYLLSSVEFFRLLLLNDCLCPYSLLLNVPSVSPTYFFVSVSDLTVASYITPWSKQCPSTGQVLFFLQL